MAGHSKWANIKHRKGRQDAIKGKLFTRLIREITVAARLAGADINSNPRLRSAVEAANGANMPKEKIDRAIKKGSGGDETQNLEEIRYEGYSPGGAAIIVDCVTDNRNRTVADVRHAFSKAGGNLGTEGCVAFLFKKMGFLTVVDIEDEDVFLPPRRYDYYVPDLENYVWVPPIEKPDDQNYYWDDDLYQEDNTTGWVLIPEPEE